MSNDLIVNRRIECYTEQAANDEILAILGRYCVYCHEDCDEACGDEKSWRQPIPLTFAKLDLGTSKHFTRLVH